MTTTQQQQHSPRRCHDQLISLFIRTVHTTPTVDDIASRGCIPQFQRAKHAKMPKEPWKSSNLAHLCNAPAGCSGTIRLSCIFPWVTKRGAVEFSPHLQQDTASLSDLRYRSVGPRNANPSHTEQHYSRPPLPNSLWTSLSSRTSCKKWWKWANMKFYALARLFEKRVQTVDNRWRWKT